MDDLDSSTDLWFLQFLYQAIEYTSKCTKYNRYHCHLFSALWKGSSILISFLFLLFSFSGRLKWQHSLDDEFIPSCWFTLSGCLAWTGWFVCLSKYQKILSLVFYDGILLLLLLFVLFWEFFTPVLTDGFSLESEWQEVSSSLQDSSQYSGWPQ